VAAAKRLIVARPDAAEESASQPDAWDPERVVRHLERAVAHGYQLVQRARWLCLLHDCAVVFQEPPSERPRLLLVCDGRVQESRDLLPDQAVPGDFCYRPLRQRQAAFDRNRYDHLRTLTSELKRVLRDRGTAAVRFGRGRWLRGSTLDALLRWV
jgi:hypothetical protein